MAPVFEASYYAEAIFESTGRGKDDWIFALKLVSGTDNRLVTLYGSPQEKEDGTTIEVVDSGKAAKWGYYRYKGSGFWNTNVIVPDFSFNTVGYQSESGGFSDLELARLVGAAGGIFSFVEWDIHFLRMRDPSQVLYTQSNGSNLTTYQFTPSTPGILQSPSLSASDSFTRIDQWNVSPTLIGFETLEAVGGKTPCRVGFTCVGTSGEYTKSNVSQTKTNALANTYSGCFTLAPQESFQPFWFDYQDDFENVVHAYEGIDRVATSYCYTSTNQTAIGAGSGDPLPPNDGHFFGSNHYSRNYNASYFVAPDIVKPIVYKAAAQGSTISETTRQVAIPSNFVTYHVFNKGKSYLYESTGDDSPVVAVPNYNKLGQLSGYFGTAQNEVIQNNGIFLSIDQEQKIVNYPNPKKYSWTVQDSKVKLYRWDYVSFGVVPSPQDLTNIFQKNRTVEVEVFDFTGNSNEGLENKTTVQATILRMPVPQATVDNTSVIATYYWPKK